MMTNKPNHVPLADIFNQVTAPAKDQRTQSNKKVWVPEYSRFKLQFIWRSGGTSIPYHSYDIHRVKNGLNVTDERVGYSKLLVWMDKNRDKYVVATIWANLTDDLRTYINGKLNMNYDHIVIKHVRGQKPMVNGMMQFKEDGKLDVALLKKGVAQ